MTFRRSLRSALLLLGLLAAPVAQARAQSAHVGLIGGATFASLRGIDGLDSRTGLVGGLSVLLPFGSFAFQPEALLVNKGAKASTGGPDGLELSYVELPLLFRLSLGGAAVRPHAYAGPYFGLEVSCKVQGTSGDCDDLPGVSTKSVDLGGIVGGGVDVDVGPLVLTGGARYGFGVSKVADFTIDAARESARNGAFALYAGVAIRLGR